MHLVMNRDFTVTSLSGHAIRFKKGEPTYVPPEIVSEAMAVGAVPADGEPVPVQEEQEEKRPIPVGMERKKVLVGVFDQLVKENRREAFTAAGIPKLKEVRDQLWFDIDGAEMKDVWYEYQAGELGEDD